MLHITEMLVIHGCSMIFKRQGIKTLTHPTRYLYQIRKLAENAQKNGISQLFTQKQTDVPLFNFYFDAHNLADILSADVRSETYRLTHPKQRLIKTKTKMRLIYEYSLTDKIILGVLSQVLNECLEEVISDKSYAFRTGIKVQDVLENWSRYLRTHKKKNINEFYFFRTDFVNYSDEINVNENSVFWSNLSELLSRLGVYPTTYQWGLIRYAIRPEYYNLEGRLQCNLMGVPTGTSIVNFTNNFYAYKVDNLIGNDSSLLYIRYCDDIFICHPEKRVLLQKKDELNAMIQSLSLRTNAKKNFLGYFSPSGKACDDPQFTGCNSYEYLGYRMYAEGTFSLSRQRIRKFLRSIYQHINHIRYSAHFKSTNQAGKIICHALNDVMIKRIICDHGANALLKESSNHAQLKHLDYLIALRVAETLSGVKGVRAFRKVPYQTIRDIYHLQSLVNLRNRAPQ
jgi:hypothetical protein